MLQESKSRWRSFDWVLFGAVLLIVLLGLSTIYSTVLAGQNQPTDLITKQLLGATVGLLAFFLITWTHPIYLYYAAPLLYILTIILLVGLLFLVDPIRGIRGWYVLGSIQFQPAELAKISVSIVLAAYVAFVGNRLSSWRGLAGALLLLLIPFSLIAVQPDLGSAAVILLIGAAIICFGQVDWKKLGILVLLCVALMPIFYGQLADYQKERIISFMSPGADPLGSGYNQIQSMIAVGSGQLTGRGWGRGTQSHLQFLPEQHTDFIFATFSEEFGLLGSFVILLLFGVITYRCFSLAVQVRDSFMFSLVMGMAIFLIVQFIVNVGMNIGILPVVGLPLPFMSYGGSSLVFTLVAIGVVEAVAVRRNP